MDNFRHPIDLVKVLRSNYGDSLFLEFSQYNYRPRTVIDERIVFKVSISEIDAFWLDRELSKLPPGWELALNSRVIDARGRTRHLPMIDFIGRPDEGSYEHFGGILGPAKFKRLAFFDSGRSFHGYAPILMPPGEWVGFMGRLLLLNIPERDHIVDARWIGHRLIGGFSALRWSNNSGSYVAVPAGVERHEVFRYEKNRSN